MDTTNKNRIINKQKIYTDMGKSASTLPNMVITLLVITAAAGAGLGFVYKLTEEPVALARLQKQQNAIKEVVPDFDNDPGAEVYETTSKEGAVLKIFPAKKNGEVVGVAVETVSNNGFNGEVKVMVGMKPDGTIINYTVLEHKETPGLGTKMVNWFKPQGEVEKSLVEKIFGFEVKAEERKSSILGKNPAKDNLTVARDGGEIDAITAATISSRAFLEAVVTAGTTYLQTGGEEQIDGKSSATIKNSEKEGGEQ